MQTHERETAHGRITEGGGGKESGPPPPTNKSPKIGFLSILVRFPLKSQSYQVSIPCWVINQRNANLTVFRWQANDDPLLWCLDPLSHHQLNKIKALRVLMGTAVFKRSSLQIGRFLV